MRIEGRKAFSFRNSDYDSTRPTKSSIKNLPDLTDLFSPTVDFKSWTPPNSISRDKLILKEYSPADIEHFK